MTLTVSKFGQEISCMIEDSSIAAQSSGANHVTGAAAAPRRHGP